VTEIWQGLKDAFILIFTVDSEVMGIVYLSLGVSGSAIVISSLIGISLGIWLAYRRFISRRLAIALMYTGMGFPPVVVGLLVFLLLSRSGPFGWTGWLFTPKAMVLAQVIIASPIIASFTMVAVMAVNRNLLSQARSLGATNIQVVMVALQEARVGILVAVLAGFGRIISEVGAVMIVGGNLKGSTQVLTTATVQFARMGLFEQAIVMGLILLSITFLTSLLWIALQGGGLEGR
jgi:tungstate transport system permease protein